MGGTASCPYPRYGCCIRTQNPNICKENHTSTPRVKGHRRNLSAAFNLAEMAPEFSVELLDINRATEEELMTLPGINRRTAQNIVEYRRVLGGFKKVEDIALVSGVGATRLHQIRMEIGVGRKKSSGNTSQNSSRQDVSIQDDLSRASSKSVGRDLAALVYQRINLNSSNVFQLMKVKGITQDMAQDIVAYRDKKGRFHQTDDLLKVKSVRPAILSAIRPYLCLHDEQQLPMEMAQVNGTLPNSQRDSQTIVTDPRTNKSHSNVLTNNNLSDSQEDMISLYGPLARKSFRNGKKPVVFRKNGRHILRVATWNLQACGSEKSENPGVKEVLAMSVLENGLSLLVVQELVEEDALQKLCDELNAPTVPNVRKWAGHQGSWKCITSSPVGSLGPKEERLGYLYDISRGIEHKSISVLDSHQGQALVNKPCVAVFKVKEWEVAIVGLHVTSGGTTATEMADIVSAVDGYCPHGADVIIVGDFYTDPSAPECGSLKQRGYKNVLVADNYTNISTRNPEGTRCSNNIWMSDGVRCMYTGNHDVVREGMTSPWIPDGWGWGGVVSSHCPVWAEFYIDAHPSPTVEESLDETQEGATVSLGEQQTTSLSLGSRHLNGAVIKHGMVVK